VAKLFKKKIEKKNQIEFILYFKLVTSRSNKDFTWGKKIIFILILFSSVSITIKT